MAETKYYDVHPSSLEAWLKSKGAVLAGLNGAKQKVYRAGEASLVVMGRVNGYVRVKVVGRCSC